MDKRMTDRLFWLSYRLKNCEQKICVVISFFEKKRIEEIIDYCNDNCRLLKINCYSNDGIIYKRYINLSEIACFEITKVSSAKYDTIVNVNGVEKLKN